VAGVLLGALSGYTIAVTADRRREEQAELIERRGGSVLYGPVIRTLPLADEEGLRDATEALVAHPPDVVVLCTAIGVRGWATATESLGLHDDLLDALAGADVVVRGPKAAGAALTAGLQVTWQTPGATYTEVLEHLAARPTRHLDGRPVRVAVQLDGADSAPLLTELPALGYEVVPVPVYRWHLPDDRQPAERLIAAVADRSVDAVTFTSAHAVSNFMTLAADIGRRDEVVAACQGGDVLVTAVGPVTSARARASGLGGSAEPRQPRLGAMVQALVRGLDERSNVIDLAGTPLLLQGRLAVVGAREPVVLTDRERAVLVALTRRPGAVVSKQALLDQVWAGESDDHVVEVTIGRLRRRLGDAGGFIETVMRRGYRIAAT
jgi:uroporphyrinogen-III synthase